MKFFDKEKHYESDSSEDSLFNPMPKKRSLSDLMQPEEPKDELSHILQGYTDPEGYEADINECDPPARGVIYG